MTPYDVNSNTTKASESPEDTQKKEIEREIKKHAELKKNRSTTETTWAEAYHYTVPRKDDVISSVEPGSERGTDLFDTTSINANQLLSAQLHGMLSNPAQVFFEMRMESEELNNDDEVRRVLQARTKKMSTVINNSNFQTEIHEVYIDLGAIGNSCMFVGEHPEKIVHFNTRAMKEIWWEENELGLVTRVHREYSWDLHKIVTEFGLESLNDELRRKYTEGCADKFTIVHIVCERAKDDLAPTNQKFKECYILVEIKKYLREKGYYEFPYMTPRWTKVAGEEYGRGPGIDMLPDIRMVNKMMETTLQGAEMTVLPPYAVQDDSVTGRVRLTPAGITVIRYGAEMPKALVTDARIDFGYQAVEDVRKRIRSGFFTDKIQLNSGPQKTATEVDHIVDEQLRFMGPIMGRLDFELLRLMIERVHGIMDRRGEFDAPEFQLPEKARGKKWVVRYSSLVARAQRMHEGQNFLRGIQVIAPLVNAKPEALDNLNGDRAFRYILGDVYGAPQEVFNDQREIKKIRDARAAAMEAAARQKAEQHQADVASKVAPGVAQLQQAQGAQ